MTDWRRTKAEPVPEMAELRRRLVEHAANSRTAEDLAGFIEEWIGRRKPALGADELEIQRKYGWRPFLTHSALVRVTSKDEWNSGRPKEAYEAVPRSAASPDAAVQFVIRAHLRAFGPASIADVAAWTGLRTPVLRAAVERLQPELERFEDEAGRTLYDLRGAPLPDPEVPAPVRLLPWFDSVVLAYEPAQRARILPDQYRDLVYQRVRLQWLPTFLVDGLVAGTWALRADKRAATLSLQPFESLPKGVRSELEAEAERLLDATRPAVTRRRVVWA